MKENPNLSRCRVVLQEKGSYRIFDMNTEKEQQAVLSGKFRYGTDRAADYPTVGDFVLADTGTAGCAVIHQVLPRKSVFLRKAAGTANREQLIAANIDTVFICMSLNQDFNLRRLERYLSVIWDSGAVPVIILTKADLCNNLSERIAQTEQIAIGTDILTTSATEKNAEQKILPYLGEGKTVAFVGSSGVGKSTLINRLTGKDTLRTGNLRKDGKGHHTTTHRALIRLPGHGDVIDTPGMREFGLWDADTGFDTAFSDIAALAEKCRFRDCTHGSEPGCAVREARDRGDLSEERFRSYEKLRTENNFAKDKIAYLSEKEKKRKDIAKYNKTNQKK